MRPEASEDVGGNPLEAQPGYDSMAGMSTMQNFMIIGLVFAVIALYLRSRMRADAEAAMMEKSRV